MDEVRTAPPTELDILGAALKELDELTILLLWRRMQIALQIGRHKQQAGIHISRPYVEQKRLEHIGQFADTLDIDPYFAQAILHTVIGESCKVQLRQLQDHSVGRGSHSVKPTEKDLAARLLILARTLSQPI